MSSEIVKKRGRPKKVVPDPVEPEAPEVMKKTTTRAKSTKATTSKVTKVKAATPTKASPSKTAASKNAKAPLPPQNAAGNPPPVPSAKVEPQAPTAPVEQAPKSPVTPETSKILSQVRELSQKPTPVGEEVVKSSKPSPTTITSKSNSSTPLAKSSASKTSKPILNAPKANTPSPTPPPAPKASPPPPPLNPKPTPKPHAALTSLNSEIVSNITTRAGARPNASGSNYLPPNYKSTASKVTRAIVAAPIAIVTSYILYERLVLGRERKYLLGPIESGPEVEIVPPTSTPSESS